jgi:hypothetical protein
MESDYNKVMFTNLGPKGIQEGLAARGSGIRPMQARLTPRSAKPGDPFRKSTKIITVRAALRWKSYDRAAD